MSLDASAFLASPSPSPSALAQLVNEAERAHGYASQARATNTTRAYRSDVATFTAWANERGLVALPALPATVATYAAHLAGQGRAVSTIGRAMVSLSQAHRLAGHDSPTSSAIVRDVLKGIRREKGAAQKGAAPILVAQLRSMVEGLPVTLLGHRDRALLLVGWAAALRRSELVALDVEDLAFDVEGLVVTIRRSKTDQDGEGARLAVPFGSIPATCPVRALRRWLDAAAIVTGPVFRAVSRWGQLGEARLSDRAVALVVKRYGATAGLDSALVSGHSLRAGMATQAAKSGKSERAIMRQTRHRSVAMVRRYIRDADMWTDNAAAGLGL